MASNANRLKTVVDDEDDDASFEIRQPKDVIRKKSKAEPAEEEDEGWEEVEPLQKAEKVKEKAEDKPERKPKKLKGIKGKIQAVKNFLADERTHKVSGLLLILSSFFMLVAFTSNFFTWQEDQAVAG